MTSGDTICARSIAKNVGTGTASTLGPHSSVSCATVDAADAREAVNEEDDDDNDEDEEAWTAAVVLRPVADA